MNEFEGIQRDERHLLHASTTCPFILHAHWFFPYISYASNLHNVLDGGKVKTLLM
jgi:hypothetical protein